MTVREVLSTIEEELKKTAAKELVQPYEEIRESDKVIGQMTHEQMVLNTLRNNLHQTLLRSAIRQVLRPKPEEIADSTKNELLSTIVSALFWLSIRSSVPNGLLLDGVGIRQGGAIVETPRERYEEKPAPEEPVFVN